MARARVGVSGWLGVLHCLGVLGVGVGFSLEERVLHLVQGVSRMGMVGVVVLRAVAADLAVVRVAVVGCWGDLGPRFDGVSEAMMDQSSWGKAAPNILEEMSGEGGAG